MPAKALEYSLGGGRCLAPGAQAGRFNEASAPRALLPMMSLSPVGAGLRLAWCLDCAAGVDEVWACANAPPMVRAANSITLPASNGEMGRRCCVVGIDSVSGKS